MRDRRSRQRGQHVLVAEGHEVIEQGGTASGGGGTNAAEQGLKSLPRPCEVGDRVAATVGAGSHRSPLTFAEERLQLSLDGRTVRYDGLWPSVGRPMDARKENVVLADYLQQFKALNVNRRGGLKVHKPLMLLTVIDLAERGALAENRIRYEDTLEGFAEYAEAVRPDSRLDAFYPFYHLKTSDFWEPDRKDNIRPTHDLMLGRTAALTSELHRLVCNDADARLELRGALIQEWLSEDHDTVWRVVERRRSPNEYEHDLRGAQKPIDTDDLPDPVRSSAFRRLVLQAYDYRCAATGLRILLPGPRAIVDAAHLIPWEESHDDRPTNGIALTPTFHRALDWRLIAPGPDMTWRVSEVLDKRIRDNEGFLELQGQPVLTPGDHCRPATEALKWRVDNLLRR